MSVTNDARQIFALAQARGKARSYKHCVIDAMRQVRDTRNPAQASMPYGQAEGWNPRIMPPDFGQALDIRDAVAKLPQDEYQAVSAYLIAGCPAQPARHGICRATLRNGLDMLKSPLFAYSER